MYGEFEGWKLDSGFNLPKKASVSSSSLVVILNTPRSSGSSCRLLSP